MATAGSATQATIDVAGRSSNEVAHVVAAAVATEGTYTVAPAGPGAVQLVRTYRPTWAIAAGVLGLLFFGLGILFFLVRKTEVCTLKVVDGPTGAVLTVTGTLAATTRDAVLAALSRGENGAQSASPASSASPLPTPAPVVRSAPAASESAPTGAPRVGIPAPSAELAPPTGTSVPLPAPLPLGAAAAHQRLADRDAIDFTVHRPTAVQGPSRGYVLRLPDGRSLPLVGTTLLGRDPASAGGAGPSPTLVALADPSFQVSKTHAAVRVAAGGVQVEDLHSTNGTVIAEPTGTRTTLRGGQVAAISPGSILELGGLRIEVVTGA